MEIYVLLSKYRDEDSEVLGMFSTKEKTIEGFLKVLGDEADVTGWNYTPAELADYTAQFDLGGVEIGRTEYWWHCGELDSLSVYTSRDLRLEAMR